MYTPMLIRENRWRAMRYSFDEGLIDLAKGEVVPFEELLNELLCLVAEDAEALGCTEEVNSLQHIAAKRARARTGSSRNTSWNAPAAPATKTHSRAVVDMLIKDTAKGL